VESLRLKKTGMKIDHKMQWIPFRSRIQQVSLGGLEILEELARIRSNPEMAGKCFSGFNGCGVRRP
jgi:hypothetical protein